MGTRSPPHSSFISFADLHLLARVDGISEKQSPFLVVPLQGRQIKGPEESPYLNPDDIQQLKARALPKPAVEKQGEIGFHK